MARLIVRDRSTGRVKLDSSTNAMLHLGTASIGGAGTAQSGTITDDRFLWGTGVAFTLLGGFVGRDGYEAVFTFSGSTLTWQYPRPGSSSAERAPVTFLYGVIP